MKLEVIWGDDTLPYLKDYPAFHELKPEFREGSLVIAPIPKGAKVFVADATDADHGRYDTHYLLREHKEDNPVLIMRGFSSRTTVFLRVRMWIKDWEGPVDLLGGTFRIDPKCGAHVLVMTPPIAMSITSKNSQNAGEQDAKRS